MSGSGWVEVVPGGRARALLCTEDVMVVEWVFRGGAVVEEHSHDELQVTICKDGDMVLVVEGVEHRLRSGDYLVVEPGKKHSARFLADTRVVDVFVPPRRGLAEKLCPRSG